MADRQTERLKGTLDLLILKTWAKFYRLTSAGRRQLGVEKRTWVRIAGAIGSVLEAE